MKEFSKKRKRGLIRTSRMEKIQKITLVFFFSLSLVDYDVAKGEGHGN